MVLSCDVTSEQSVRNGFDALLAELTGKVKGGDVVLLKGSRGVQLERLVEPLLKNAA